MGRENRKEQITNSKNKATYIFFTCYCRYWVWVFLCWPIFSNKVKTTYIVIFLAFNDPPLSLLGRSLGRKKAKEKNVIAFSIFSPKLRISRVVFACTPSAMLARHHIGSDLNVRNVYKIYISYHVTLAKIARVSRS